MTERLQALVLRCVLENVSFRSKSSKYSREYIQSLLHFKTKSEIEEMAVEVADEITQVKGIRRIRPADREKMLNNLRLQRDTIIELHKQFDKFKKQPLK